MPLPHPSRPPAPIPASRWLLAMVVLLVVLWACQACYSTFRDLRQDYLGPGLRTYRSRGRRQSPRQH